MDQKRPFVLSIAGLDPSAGAGILADIKTMEQCGVNGLAVNTALTYQNEDEFDGVKWVAFDDIKKQLDPLFRKYEICVVKIGLIENMNVLKEVLSYLNSRHGRSLKIIWDPILSASAGFEFHSEVTIEMLSELLGELFLITPNQDEYAQLGSMVGVNVLLKGGHSEVKNDLLKQTNKQEVVIKGMKGNMNPKHGSGCILSSAIASYLALGESLEDACISGKKYVERVLKSNKSLLGYHK